MLYEVVHEVDGAERVVYDSGAGDSASFSDAQRRAGEVRRREGGVTHVRIDGVVKKTYGLEPAKKKRKKSSMASSSSLSNKKGGPLSKPTNGLRKATTAGSFPSAPRTPHQPTSQHASPEEDKSVVVLSADAAETETWRKPPVISLKSIVLADPGVVHGLDFVSSDLGTTTTTTTRRRRRRTGGTVVLGRRSVANKAERRVDFTVPEGTKKKNSSPDKKPSQCHNPPAPTPREVANALYNNVTAAPRPEGTADVEMKAADGAATEGEEAAACTTEHELVWSVGDVVSVAPRMGKGENKPGGVAHVTAVVAQGGALNVKYVLGGSGKGVPFSVVSRLDAAMMGGVSPAKRTKSKKDPHHEQHRHRSLSPVSGEGGKNPPSSSLSTARTKKVKTRGVAALAAEEYIEDGTSTWLAQAIGCESSLLRWASSTPKKRKVMARQVGNGLKACICDGADLALVASAFRDRVEARGEEPRRGASVAAWESLREAADPREVAALRDIVASAAHALAPHVSLSKEPWLPGAPYDDKRQQQGSSSKNKGRSMFDDDDDDKEEEEEEALVDGAPARALVVTLRDLVRRLGRSALTLSSTLGGAAAALDVFAEGLGAACCAQQATAVAKKTPLSRCVAATAVSLAEALGDAALAVVAKAPETVLDASRLDAARQALAAAADLVAKILGPKNDALDDLGEAIVLRALGSQRHDTHGRPALGSRGKSNHDTNDDAAKALCALALSLDDAFLRSSILETLAHHAKAHKPTANRARALCEGDARHLPAASNQALDAVVRRLVLQQAPEATSTDAAP